VFSKFLSFRGTRGKDYKAVTVNRTLKTDAASYVYVKGPVD
jgi:hypothetical protein